MTLTADISVPCETDPDLFFSEAPRAVAAAKTLCAGCGHTETCANLAMTAERGENKSNRFGIFGGLTPDERWAIDHTEF